MVSRVPPPADGSKPRTSSALAILLVVALALGIWLLNGRDPGTSTDPGPSSDRSSQTQGAAPGGSDEGDGEGDGEPGEPAGSGESGEDPESGWPYVDLAGLPPEAGQTVRLIDSGGPFPYAQDGSEFQNREGRLPDEAGGYYSEYTVETPGSPDRGPRRIVAGDGGELYWTPDHYETFGRITR